MNYEITIGPLTAVHNRAKFDCGTELLNEFLQKHARQNQKQNVSRTFVATGSESVDVLGFYTLSVTSVEKDSLVSQDSMRLPRYPVPMAHLARLAVDKRAQGEGVASFMMQHAFDGILNAAELIGIFGIEVVAKDLRAQKLYEKFGFKKMHRAGVHLYLPISAISKSVQ
jgi:ribosomal protein S18 acetylase RimI-like enzyme